MIPVTKPFSPPIDEYQQFLDGIWERNWFTNNGPLVNDLELKLKRYLGLNHLLYVSNGTIAIQIALKVLGITKKVITTPFSYVATTSSLVWEGCTPVFVDINPQTFNIDPSKIEAAIDSDTEAILATHCFGNPCDIDAIDKIAKKHDLKVIYDAAHCFGTTYKGKSVFAYGDVSTASFHATKLFHTIEGGAVFTQDPNLLKRMVYMRNFGHDGPEKFNGVGINGKNSEFHAAMGLVNLNHVDAILKNRKNQYDLYLNALKELPVYFQKTDSNSKNNYSYFPLVFQNETQTLEVKRALEKNDIYPRRYFYPSLNQIGYTKGIVPNSEKTSKSILCLPLYQGLKNIDQFRIIQILKETIS